MGKNAEEVQGAAALALPSAFAVVRSIMPNFAIGFACGYSGIACAYMPLAAQIADRGVTIGFSMMLAGYGGREELFWIGLGTVAASIIVA